MFFNRQNRRRIAGVSANPSASISHREGETFEGRQLMTAICVAPPIEAVASEVVAADAIVAVAAERESAVSGSQPEQDGQHVAVDALFETAGRDPAADLLNIDFAAARERNDGREVSPEVLPLRSLAGDLQLGNFRINNDPVSNGGLNQQPVAGPQKNFTTVTGKNAGKTTWDYYSDLTNVPMLKNNAAIQMGQLQATQVTGRPTFNKLTGNATITNIKGGTGQIFGTFGARDCIGVVAVNESTGTVWVFHFTATEDPVDTLANFSFPAGTHAAVCGGNNCWASNETLEEVRTGLKNGGVKVDGFLDRDGVYFDWDNKKWVYTSLCNPSRNKAVPD